MPAIQTNIVVPTLCVHSPLSSVARLNYTYRNKVDNGAFAIWQRGVSFALTTAAYTADRWYVSLVGNVTRESFLPGESELMDNSRYYLKTNPSGSLPAFIEQRVESVWTLAGKQTTLTFWAKAGISGSVMSVTAIQYFGTGGSANVATVVASATLTTAWIKHTMVVTVPSISGKTVGTDGNDYVAIRFSLPIDDVSLCNVQWEQGPLATDFELRPYDEELRLCQRFYEQTDLTPDQFALAGVGISGTQALFAVPYQEKRIIPTITMPAALKIYGIGDTPTWSAQVPDTSSTTIGNQIARVPTGPIDKTVVVGRASEACNIKIDAEI